MNRLALMVAVAFFSVIGLAALSVPQDSCNLNIENSGTTENPFYEPDCAGACDSGSCSTHTLTGGGATEWDCECDGAAVDTKCAGGFLSDPTGYSISCEQNGCQNTCVKAGLPVSGSTTVRACTCVDVN